MVQSGKTDKKAKLRAWRDAEHAKARLEFPLSDQMLAEFFAGIESLRATHGCFHDTRHAEATLVSLECSTDDIERVFAWCESNGGYCDCEIVANTEQHWQECRVRT